VGQPHLRLLPSLLRSLGPERRRLVGGGWPGRPSGRFPTSLAHGQPGRPSLRAEPFTPTTTRCVAGVSLGEETSHGRLQDGLSIRAGCPDSRGRLRRSRRAERKRPADGVGDPAVERSSRARRLTFQPLPAGGSCLLPASRPEARRRRGGRAGAGVTRPGRDGQRLPAQGRRGLRPRSRSLRRGRAGGRRGRCAAVEAALSRSSEREIAFLDEMANAAFRRGEWPRSAPPCAQ
jgi:hypothetical protein